MRMDSAGLFQPPNPEAIKGSTCMLWSYGYLEIWTISKAAKFGLNSPQQGG